MSEPPKPIPDEEASFTAASRALFHLGRTFSKLPMRQILAAQTTQAIELSQILVVQAVQTATADGRMATVGDVAEQLAIDPSTASRLVTQTIRAGYLTRMTAQHDGRAVQLTLTSTGEALADQAHHYQRAVFDQITSKWSTEERRTFAHLFVKFASAVTETLENQQAI